MTPTGFVFYRGPSELDGSPIVGIATLKSANVKTGNMVQTWIMRDDIEPHIASRSDLDKAVCGDCPLRPSDTGVCYVLTFNGPLQVYRAHKADRYPDMMHVDIPSLLHGRAVRLGSYGDPAAIPQSTWDNLLTWAKGYVGYTHQWRRFPWLKSYCQASCDTAADVREAAAGGWKAFAVVPIGTDRRKYQSQTGELFHDCPAVTGRKSTTCESCGLCNGRRANIIIDVHGRGKSKLQGQ